MRLRCRSLWTRQGVLPDATVDLDGPRVVTVRPGRASDGPAIAGLVVPGLINAHTHLELSDLAGTIAASDDYYAWFDHLRAAPRRPTSADTATGAAVALRDLGTAAAVDVSNHGDTAPALVRAGLHGIVQHELLGFHAADLAARLATARRHRARADLTVRASPHALLSTPAELVAACVRAPPVGTPASLHLGETPAEDRLLLTGDGPAAELLDRLGRDWRWWRPPGRTAVELLADLNLLGPGLLLVHGLFTPRDDRRWVADRGSALCLCPRSNLHVAGRLPDVRGWWRDGVPLLLGTDSLASAPDLDVLAEAATLAARFPDVPPQVWLAGVTHVAADALGLTRVGAVEPGRGPGLLELDLEDPRDLVRGAPARRWLCPPVAPSLPTEHNHEGDIA